jgi:hypothetical protein
VMISVQPKIMLGKNREIDFLRYLFGFSMVKSTRIRFHTETSLRVNLFSLIFAL